MQSHDGMMLKESFNKFSEIHHELIKYLSELLASEAVLNPHIAAIRMKVLLWNDDMFQIRSAYLKSSPKHTSLVTLTNEKITLPFLAANSEAWDSTKRIVTLISNLRAVFYQFQNTVAEVLESLDLGYLKKQIEIQSSLSEPQEPAPKWGIPKGFP